MADIFGREDINYGGSFAADSAVVALSSTTCSDVLAGGNTTGVGLSFGVGLLAQNLTFVYQQPIQRFYELGANYTYFFAGRPSGQGAIARLLGPRVVSEAFYTAFGNVCCIGANAMGVIVGARCTFNQLPIPEAQPQGNTLQLWILSGVCLTSVGGQIAAEDMIFREQLSFMFFRLSPPLTLVNTPPPPVIGNATFEGSGGDFGGEFEGGGGDFEVAADALENKLEGFFVGKP